jgi:hypothetical protein
MVRKKKVEVLQTKKQLIINALSVFSFASSFAKISTSTRLCDSFCLRMQSIITAFANENHLFFNYLAINRLQHRLQICQLSSLTSLQVQAVSFAVCKERNTVNQPFNRIFFAALFANNNI